MKFNILERDILNEATMPDKITINIITTPTEFTVASFDKPILLKTTTTKKLFDASGNFVGLDGNPIADIKLILDNAQLKYRLIKCRLS